MRRHDREIHDRAEIDEILVCGLVCRLGLCKEGIPYVVPVSYGYDRQYLYFHTARQGQKLDYIAANPRVCFEVELGVRLHPSPDGACEWGMAYQCVIGLGTVEELTDPEARLYGLRQIMAHYSGGDWEFDQATLRATRVWRIAVDEISGKRCQKP